MFRVQFLTLLHLPRGPSLRLIPKDTSPVDIKAHPASGQATTWFSGSIWAFFLVRPKWRIWPQTAGLSEVFLSEGLNFVTSTPCLRWENEGNTEFALTSKA